MRQAFFSVLMIAAISSHAAEVSTFLQDDGGGHNPRVALTRTGSVFVWASEPVPGKQTLVAAFDERREPLRPDQRIVLSQEAFGPYAVASDGERALVIWLHGTALIFAIIAPQEVLATGVLTLFAGNAAPAVTWNGSEFVVAWIDVSQEIVATTVSRDGHPASLHVLASRQAGVPGSVAIAGSLQQTVVTWDTYVYDPTCDCAQSRAVDAVVASPTAEPLEAPRTIAVDASSPSIAANGEEFLIAFNANNSAHAVWFSGPRDGQEFTIDETGFMPRVTVGNDGFAVVWLARLFGTYPVLDSMRVGTDGTMSAGPLHETSARHVTPSFDIAGRSSGALVIAIDNIFRPVDYLPLVNVLYEDPGRFRAVRR